MDLTTSKSFGAFPIEFSMAYSIEEYLMSCFLRFVITWLAGIYMTRTYTNAWLWFTIVALIVQHEVLLDQALSCGVIINTGWYWCLVKHPYVITELDKGNWYKKFGRPLLHVVDLGVHFLPLLLLLFTRNSAGFSSLIIPFLSALHLIYWSMMHNLYRNTPFLRADDIYGFDPPMENAVWYSCLHGFLAAEAALIAVALNLIHHFTIAYTFIAFALIYITFELTAYSRSQLIIKAKTY
mmetsp:Transcript_2698/g.3486  ORF Transcript_2698/g.3486 Transcript_2698/m.3486 type:complete len:238 (+) Transcript_2698:122-835(+)